MCQGFSTTKEKAMQKENFSWILNKNKQTNKPTNVHVELKAHFQKTWYFGEVSTLASSAETLVSSTLISACRHWYECNYHINMGVWSLLCVWEHAHKCSRDGSQYALPRTQNVCPQSNIRRVVSNRKTGKGKLDSVLPRLSKRRLGFWSSLTSRVKNIKINMEVEVVYQVMACL